MNANCSRFAAACGLHRMIFTPLALAVSAAPAALKILIVVLSCAAAALAAPRQRLGPGPFLSVREIPLPQLKGQAHGPLSSLRHPFEPRLGSLSPSACAGQRSIQHIPRTAWLATARLLSTFLGVGPGSSYSVAFGIPFSLNLQPSQHTLGLGLAKPSRKRPYRSCFSGLHSRRFSAITVGKPFAGCAQIFQKCLFKLTMLI